MAVPYVPNDQTVSGGSIPVRLVGNAAAGSATYTGTGGTTVAATAKIVAPANTARRSFTLQNTSTGDMWFAYAAAPTVGGFSSFKLAAGLMYEPPAGYASNQQIQIISAAAQTYSYQEC